jgi:hypothetical protein
MPVVQSGHQLLVTLLVVNSIANETLPIFMNRCANPAASTHQCPRVGGSGSVAHKAIALATHVRIAAHLVRVSTPAVPTVLGLNSSPPER